ncbi:MAG: hypothetical protein GYA86_00980 [Firmicutes bacterium]|nr:hypothetical protein [Bacillota bacterium]
MFRPKHRPQAAPDLAGSEHPAGAAPAARHYLALAYEPGGWHRPGAAPACAAPPTPHSFQYLTMSPDRPTATAAICREKAPSS